MASDIPQVLSASDLRLELAKVAPREAATLWGTPEVIHTMNAYFDRALLEAESKGAERMKERAAAECDAEAQTRRANADAALHGSWEWGEPQLAVTAQDHKALTASCLATAIRNLEVKP